MTAASRRGDNRDKNFTRAKMKRRIAEVEAGIERYMDRLDSNDEAAPKEDNRPIREMIEALGQEMDRVKKLDVRMEDNPDRQLSMTDPDARSMKNRGAGMVSYNVQAAVDTQHYLIVAALGD